MKKSAFIKFFLFSISITAALGIFLSIILKLLQLEIPLLSINLYIGFCLFYGVGMGLFGHFYAKNTIAYINNTTLTLQDIGAMLDSTKYRKFKEADNDIVFCSNKYRQWFYGKIYIQKNEEVITINASRCIINKYFSNIA